jgi:hypothetical protein
VAPARTDASEECITSITRVKRIGELRISLAVSNRSRLLMMEAINFSKKSVLTIATRRNIPKEGILFSHYRENLKSYIALIGWTL